MSATGKKRISAFLYTLLGVAVVGYFLYHTIQGDKGVVSMIRLEHEVTLAQDNLDHLQNDRKELSHRVQLLRPESMDPDLLEEKSKELLNYSKPNEIMVMTPEQKPGVDSAAQKP